MVWAVENSGAAATSFARKIFKQKRRVRRFLLRRAVSWGERNGRELTRWMIRDDGWVQGAVGYDEWAVGDGIA